MTITLESKTGEKAVASSTATTTSDERNDNDVPPDPGAGVQTPHLSEERLSHIQIVKNSANRVKLYILCDQRTWDDRGTGHVACLQYPEDPNSWCLVVRLESNETNVLESPVHRDTVYQRQQGTLIVWSESETCDLALSFQEKSGCAAIWDKICNIQGRDPEVVDDEADVDDQQSDSSNSNGSSTIGVSITLPPCTSNNIPELEQQIVNSMSTPSSREKMANALQSQNYLARLCEVFRSWEEVQHANLSVFYSIAKNMFLLNSNLMLNELLNERYFKDVVGMLEYDPTAPEPKKHREFLFVKSCFKEVLPIKTEELKNKIQITYRVQYVQDVCLPAPSLFEENLLTCLSSHLFFSRAEIISSLMGEKELMKQLFDELKNPATGKRRRRDLIQFLREFCSFVHSLQTSPTTGRDQFFKTILTNDMLSAIDLCISSGSPATRNSAIEIIAMIVDYNPLCMRDFLLRQARSVGDQNSDDVLLNRIVGLIMLDRDPGLAMATNISTLIKNLLDAENVANFPPMGRTSPRPCIEKSAGSKSEKLEFFAMFYSRVGDTLVKPLFDNVADGKLVRVFKLLSLDDDFKANQMALIMDLVSFCIENHIQNMRNIVIQKDLLTILGVHLKSRHHFMALSALRVIRRVIQQKDELSNRYILEKRILDYVVECFVENGNRYNLMNSAILELFDFIRHDNVHSLLVYVIQNHYETALKNITYTKLFEQMNVRFHAIENCSADLLMSNASPQLESKRPPYNAQWAKERDYDSDELFFNEEDEDEAESEDVESNVDQKLLPQRKNAMEPMYPSVTKRKLNSEEDGISSIFGGNLTPPISGPNRISKIVIKMSDRPDTASPPPQTLKEEEEDTEVVVRAMQFGNGNGMMCSSASTSLTPTTSISPLATSSFSASSLSDKKPMLDDEEEQEDDDEPGQKRAKLDSISTTVPTSIETKRAIFHQTRMHSINTLPEKKSPPLSTQDVEFDKPTLLKGYSSLVDYDESDDDNEDDLSTSKTQQSSTQ